MMPKIDEISRRTPVDESLVRRVLEHNGPPHECGVSPDNLFALVKAMGEEVLSRNSNSAVDESWIDFENEFSIADVEEAAKSVPGGTRFWEQHPEIPKGTSLPFGHMYFAWGMMKDRMREGDQLRAFCSPPETWSQLRGRAGLCLVREGKAVMYLITEMN